MGERRSSPPPGESPAPCHQITPCDSSANHNIVHCTMVPLVVHRFQEICHSGAPLISGLPEIGTLSAKVGYPSTLVRRTRNPSFETLATLALQGEGPAC